MQSPRLFTSHLFCAFSLAFFLMLIPVCNLAAQETSLDRVMTMTGDTGGSQPLAVDRGSTGLWQRLLKLRTTASMIHTEVHHSETVW